MLTTRSDHTMVRTPLFLLIFNYNIRLNVEQFYFVATALVCLANLRKAFKYGARRSFPSEDELVTITVGQPFKSATHFPKSSFFICRRLEWLRNGKCFCCLAVYQSYWTSKATRYGKSPNLLLAVKPQKIFSSQILLFVADRWMHRSNLRPFGRVEQARTIRILNLLRGRSGKTRAPHEPHRVHLRRAQRAHKTEKRVLFHIQANTVVLWAQGQHGHVRRHDVLSIIGRLLGRPSYHDQHGHAYRRAKRKYNRIMPCLELTSLWLWSWFSRTIWPYWQRSYSGQTIKWGYRRCMLFFPLDFDWIYFYLCDNLGKK